MLVSQCPRSIKTGSDQGFSDALAPENGGQVKFHQFTIAFRQSGCREDTGATGNVRLSVRHVFSDERSGRTGRLSDKISGSGLAEKTKKVVGSRIEIYRSRFIGPEFSQTV